MSNAVTTAQAVGTLATNAVDAASAVANSKVVQSASDILQTYLLRALEKTGNVIDKAVDMVQEQAPILVQEVLHWYFAYNLILFICACLLTLVFLVFNYKQIQWVLAQSKLPGSQQSNLYDTYTDGLCALNVLQIVVFAMPVAAMSNLTWLKIWIAPRLWLIEYTTSLVKGH